MIEKHEQDYVPVYLTIVQVDELRSSENRSRLAIVSEVFHYFQTHSLTNLTTTLLVLVCSNPLVMRARPGLC